MDSSPIRNKNLSQMQESLLGQKKKKQKINYSAVGLKRMLCRLYCREKKTDRQISVLFGVNRKTISNWRTKHNIKSVRTGWENIRPNKRNGVWKFCRVCGDKIYVIPSANKIYCSKECADTPVEYYINNYRMFSYLVGVVQGDGHICRRVKGGRVMGVRVTVGKKYLYYAERLAQIFRDVFGCKCAVYKYKNIIQVSVHSVSVGKIFEKFKNVNGQWKIPSQYSNMWLSGIIDTDGYVSVASGYGHGCIGISQANKENLEKIVDVLNGFGVRCNIRTYCYKNYLGLHTGHVITIGRAKYLIVLHRELELLMRHKKSRFDRLFSYKYKSKRKWK